MLPSSITEQSNRGWIDTAHASWPGFSAQATWRYVSSFTINPAFQNIADGTYQDWHNLPDVMKRKYGTFPPSMLTFLSDTPQNIKMLPDEIKPETIVTGYNKDLLMFAAHMNNYSSVKYLLDMKWPVNNVTKPEESYCGNGMERTNRSALTYAAENSSIHIIKLLVAAGADVEIIDSKGNSLDFYIKNNPRFSEDEKKLGFKQLLSKYEDYSDMKPGFSCNLKLNKIEKLICSDASLSIYDRELLDSYKKATSIAAIEKSIRPSQIEWINKRNKLCSVFMDDIQTKVCLSRQERSRTRYLNYVSDAFNKSINYAPLAPDALPRAGY